MPSNKTLLERSIESLADRIVSPVERVRPITLDDVFIQTKSKQVVRFRPNEIQEMYLDQICPQWRDGIYNLSGLRESILKGRQFGLSTLICALFFVDTVNNPNTVSVITSVDHDTTQNIFMMIQRMYDHLPDDLKPRTKYASRNELYFAELNSRYICVTAGKDSAGRSYTINNLHCSEIAHWTDAAKIYGGIEGACPDSANIFFETTANGVGGFYHEEFLKAERGESSFKARFFSWKDHSEYRIDPVTAPTPTEAEKRNEDAVRQAFGLDDAQIAWMRLRLRSPAGRLFKQEFPLSAREAFVSSGHPYFNREILSLLYERLLAERTHVEFDLSGYDLLQSWKREGKLTFYKAPDPDRSYIVSADTAEGLTKSKTADSSSAEVIDHESGEQVAHFNGKPESYEFGKILAELGGLYGNAVVAIERNNHGHAVLLCLSQVMEYPNVYEHTEYDQRSGQTFKKPGFPMTVVTKPLALDTLVSQINDGEIKINCPDTAKELMSFVKLPGGKAGAEAGSHDDRVMSLAIGARLRVVIPYVPITPTVTVPPTLTQSQQHQGFNL